MRSSTSVRHLLIAVMLGVAIPAHGQINPAGPPDPQNSPAENPDRIDNGRKNLLKQFPALQDRIDGAKDAAEAARNSATDARLPPETAREGIKLATDAAGALRKQVSDIVQDALNGLEAKIEARLWELWKDLRLYLYAAAAVVFVILLVPAIIGSLVTVLLMRAIDRRRDRKAALGLHPAE
ncbi:MAG: hypothetical protein QOI05_2706 [Bradyrhizobium sp.]|jgi:hypothetical protein|nr:hypothetical protein [Bradyrhizobium sp.]